MESVRVSAKNDLNAAARLAQIPWSLVGVRERLRVLKRARGLLARMTGDLVEAMPSALARTEADTLAAEVLPLLAACRFLEGSAARILAARKLGRRGLPFWLAGVASELQRVPYGVVLVIGPANYPLFLPGVQALQGLAAGNAVVWKPGVGGKAVAEIVAAALERAGLPNGLLRVTGESISDAEAELDARPDKVFFTGSGAAARAVLHKAAETLTPCVVEASGCDAVVVLPTADQARVVDALAFGMRLNGSATCMAPRRLLVVGADPSGLIEMLKARFAALDGVVVSDATRRSLRELVREARSAGAEVLGDLDAIFLKPVLVLNAAPVMRIAQTDIFAPVLTVIACAEEEAVLAAQRACPFGLTAAIFGAESAARALGEKMEVGTVMVNDLIVPTADPRVPFGGRRGSGFGVTRGAEGLLEMTAVKTVLVRGGGSTRHYAETTKAHRTMFDGVIAAGHAPTWRERWDGVRRAIGVARDLK